MIIQSSLQANFKNKQKPVAVVLAGCGAMDGAEITEAVSILITLNQKGYNFEVFAPDRDQHHIIDHLRGAETEGSRNMLTEAARIARGKIKPISQLKANDYSALTFSGGFGAAKNLCDFAFKGMEASLQQDVETCIDSFYKAKKPIGAVCIAPILLALYGKKHSLEGVQITFGGKNDVTGVAKEWGINVIETKPGQAVVDTINQFVTAPAYMFDDATSADIMASADAMVAGISSLLK